MKITAPMMAALIDLDLYKSFCLPFNGHYRRTLSALLARGMVRRNKFGRYRITKEGRKAITDL